MKREAAKAMFIRGFWGWSVWNCGYSQSEIVASDVHTGKGGMTFPLSWPDEQQSALPSWGDSYRIRRTRLC